MSRLASGGDGAEVLQFTEEPLDKVSVGIEEGWGASPVR
jgi:hypothetical protein